MMLSFFDAPSNDPYVCITLDVNLEPGLEFMAAFEREHGQRVGVQHLVTAAVARCLADMPALNVRIVGRDFYQLESVNIAVPVQLAGGSSTRDQTGMMLLRDVERMSLSDIARQTRERADVERAGTAATFGTAAGRKLAARVPRAAEAAMLIAGGVLNNPLGARLLSKWASVSTGVTNVGSVFPMPPGARFRSVSLTMPTKLGHVASAFALAPASEAPVAEDGRVVVRRVLPISMLVDHRAIDGFLMAKLGKRLAETLLAPAVLAAPAR